MKDGQDTPLSKLGVPSVFCQECSSPLVQAVDWEHEEDSSWSVVLWCPECGHEQAATLERPQLLYLSLAMEEGFVWMLDALSELDTVSAEADSLDFADRAQTERPPSLPS